MKLYVFSKRGQTKTATLIIIVMIRLTFTEKCKIVELQEKVVVLLFI